MKILHLTDIHGNVACAKLAIEKAGGIDLVIITGDITHFGDYEEVRKVIDPIRDGSFRLLAIPGNCDHPEVIDYLESEKISLHCKGTVIDGIGFFGAGLSLPCPGKTPGETLEEHLLINLEKAASCIPKGTPCVLTVHHPPYGTLNDMPASNIHAGSWSVRTFIEKNQPMLCLAGHIHEGIGVDEIGKTKILNPGPARDGNYAVIEITPNGVKDIQIEQI